jgi:hypothetical protein
MGKSIMTLGFVIGGLNYLVTAGYFFSNDQALLGVIQLMVPPAEFVLPWVASTTLGIVSVISMVFLFIGAALTKDD